MIDATTFESYLRPGMCDVCTDGPVANVVHEDRPKPTFHWRPEAMTRLAPLKQRRLCLRCFRLWRAKVLEARSIPVHVDTRTQAEREIDDERWSDIVRFLKDELERGF